MAAIRAHDGMLAFASGNSVAFSNIRSASDFHVVTLPCEAMDKPATGKKEKEEDEGAESGGAGEGTSNRALAVSFSGGGRYLAVCDDLKKLHIFSSDTPRTPQSWTLLSSRLLVRRATSVTFTSDEGQVIVADKTGDVYTFPTTEVKVKDDGDGDVKSQGQLLLGHLSMVLDVCLADRDGYVVTCDRDEKIRVSQFPNAYNIHTYCLGHTQFVNCLIYVEEFRLLISGSGDCTVRVWNMEGEQLCLSRCGREQTAAAVTAQQTAATPVPEQSSEGKDDDGDDDEKEGATTDNRERTSIQRIAYSKKYRLLAVSFYRLSELQVLQLNVVNDQTTLHHLQTIALQQDPWDITFDDSCATLWVLSPTEGSPLSAYQIQKEGESLDGSSTSLQLHKVTGTADGVSQALATVNLHWNFFTDSVAVSSAIPTLWKTSSQDNVVQYQQRKQQRLQAHQQQQQQQEQPQQRYMNRQRGKKGKKREKEEEKGEKGADIEEQCEELESKKAREESM